MIVVRVCGVALGVECRLPTLTPIVTAMLAGYRRSRAAPRLRFTLAPHPAGARLDCNGEWLWTGDPFETAAGLEVHLYLRVLAAIAPRLLSLHAGWVTVGGRAIAFAGVSGAGKSSLVTAALLAGARYGSDEFLPLDAEGHAHPFPRPLQWGRVRHPAFSHRTMHRRGFAKFRFCFHDHTGRRRLNLWWLPPRLRRRRAALALLALPRFTPGARPTIEPVPRSVALLETAAELHHRRGASADIRALDARLPRGLPIVRLRFGDAHAAWRALTDYVARNMPASGR